MGNSKRTGSAAVAAANSAGTRMGATALAANCAAPWSEASAGFPASAATAVALAPATAFCRNERRLASGFTESRLGIQLLGGAEDNIARTVANTRFGGHTTNATTA